jgi:hypothetical protein
MRPRLALILAASLWTMLGGFLRQVYSREQAREGRTLFYDVCLTCHADPFWKAAWRGSSLADIVVADPIASDSITVTPVPAGAAHFTSE